jgi:hypothetical protein
MFELKRSGKPTGLGSRSVMLKAVAAASRSASGTSVGCGSLPLRMISTTWMAAFDEKCHGIHERELQQMRR